MPNAIDMPQSSLPSTEVVLHELGEGLAISIATVQNELARYPNDIGAFLLDEIEVTIPVRLRVDELGQLRVRIVENAPDKPECELIHLRIRPVVGTTQPVPHCADQPLSALGDVLSPGTIKRLEELRVFSIEDFLRVARDTAGQHAIKKLLPRVKLSAMIDRATLFTFPDLAPRLATTLVQIGVTSPMDFVKRDSKSLADEINKRLEGKSDESLTPEDVSNLQSFIKQLTQIRLPGRQPNLQSTAPSQPSLDPF